MKVLFLSIVLWHVLQLVEYSSCHSAYHTYDEISAGLASYAKNYSNQTHLYSIGKSVQGRDLWVLAIAASQPDKHVLLRPEVKFIGNIHGNELPTGELLLNYIRLLLKNPDKNEDVDFILNNMRVHILVAMNPDGMNAANDSSCTSENGKNNSNGFDLNLNFPDRFFCNAAPIQPETEAILNWLESTRFLLSGKFHTGGVAVTYPYENFPNSQLATRPQYTATEDDDVFRHLAKLYSLNHKTLVGTVCNGESFADGITNGGWIKL
jgi:hypothetical protein